MKAMADDYDPEFPTSDNSSDSVRKEHFSIVKKDVKSAERDDGVSAEDLEKFPTILNNICHDKSEMNRDYTDTGIGNHISALKSDSELPRMHVESSKSDLIPNHEDQETVLYRYPKSNAAVNVETSDPQLDTKLVNGLDIDEERSVSQSSTPVLDENNVELDELENCELSKNVDAKETNSEHDSHSAENSFVKMEERSGGLDLMKESSDNQVCVEDTSNPANLKNSEPDVTHSRRRSTRIQIRRSKSDVANTATKKSKNSPSANTKKGSKNSSKSHADEELVKNSQEDDSATEKVIPARGKRSISKEKMPDKRLKKEESPSPTPLPVENEDSNLKNKKTKPKRVAKASRAVKAPNMRGRRNSRNKTPCTNEEPAENETTASTNETVSTVEENEVQDVVGDKGVESAENLVKSVEPKIEKQPDTVQVDVKADEDQNKHSDEHAKVEEEPARNDAKISKVASNNVEAKKTNTYEVKRRSQRNRKVSTELSECSTESMPECVPDKIISSIKENSNDSSINSKESSKSSNNDLLGSCFNLYDGLPNPKKETLDSPVSEEAQSTIISPLDTATNLEQDTKKPEKVKSRWRRSCELENLVTPSSSVHTSEAIFEESNSESSTPAFDNRTNLNELTSSADSSASSSVINLSNHASPKLLAYPIEPDHVEKQCDTVSNTESMPVDFPDKNENRSSGEPKDLSYSLIQPKKLESDDVVGRQDPDSTPMNVSTEQKEIQSHSNKELVTTPLQFISETLGLCSNNQNYGDFSNGIPVSGSLSSLNQEVNQTCDLENENKLEDPSQTYCDSVKNETTDVKSEELDSTTAIPTDLNSVNDTMESTGELNFDIAERNFKEECTGLKKEIDEDNKLIFSSYSQENFKMIEGLPFFNYLPENKPISGRKKSRDKKEVRRMLCDCYLTEEEFENGCITCDDSCLNRLLMIECGSRCINGDRCSNKRFQKHEYVNVLPFKTELKGWGLKTLEDLDVGQFIIEYVGEILNHKEFKQRVKQYSKEKCQHYYFMSLRADEILDATYSGNVSRYINHSCDPNIETQKWTVNGELRIGFFANRKVACGEELTFDYQFQRYGREAQKCHCGSENCRGYIGGEKQVSLKMNKVLTKKKKTAEEKKRELFEDMDLDIEVDKFSSQGGLKNRDDTLKLCRLMVRAEDPQCRQALLNVLQNTNEQACLRLFLDYHGLSLIWSWMANIRDDDIKLKTQILETLVFLPITNKTTLEDSKVIDVVKRWAMQMPSSTEPKENKEQEAFIDGESSSTESQDSSTSKPIAPKAHDESEYVKESGSQVDIVVESQDMYFNLEEIPLPPSPPPARTFEAMNNCDMELDSGEDESHAEVSTTERESCNQDLPDSSSFSKDPIKKSIDETPAAQIIGEDSQDSQSFESGAETKSDDDENQDNNGSDGSEQVANLASKILESWSSLKELFRIPKRELEQKGYEKEGDEKIIFEHMIDSSTGKRTLLPNPPSPQPLMKLGSKRSHKFEGERINKHERRMKFALEMKQRDEEEAIRRHEEMQRLQEEERKQKQAELIFAAATALCNEPSYEQPPLPEFNGMFVAPQQPTEIDLGMVPPPSVPPDNVGMIYNNPPPPVPAQTILPPPVIVPSVLPQPDVPCPSPSPFPQIPTQHPPPTQFMQGPPPPVALPHPPTVPQIPSSYPGPIPLQQPQFVPPPMLPQQPAPHMIPASTANPLPQYLHHPQGPPMIATAPPPTSTPIYYIQHPTGGQPTPVVIMPELEIKDPVPPPPSPPKSKKNRLPTNWRSAKDSEGNTYYYHSVTRKTQWEPPAWPQAEEPAEPYQSEKHKHSRKKSMSTTTAAADTSSELVKKTKELFRAKISSFIVHCLNPFRKPDCKLGRITSTEDFKHLARKLTHFVMAKELKHCQNVEDLECNENVKHKAKDFVSKYLAKYGPVYRKDKSSPKEY